MATKGDTAMEQLPATTVKETPAQAGRYLAMTVLFGAMIDLIAEIGARDPSDVRDDIKARVDILTATHRLGAASHPELAPAIQMMDRAVAAALGASIRETAN
jgi:hypothetical protein